MANPLPAGAGLAYAVGQRGFGRFGASKPHFFVTPGSRLSKRLRWRP